MKALITGDWHLGVTQYGVLQDDGRNSRVVDVESVLHRVIDFADKEGVELFVCCGDIFHTNRPTQEEQIIFLDILNHLERSKIKNIRFIIGNHDHNSRLGASHALKLFKKILEQRNSRISIFDETTWIPETVGDGKDVLVCYHPYHAAAPDWLKIGQYQNIDCVALVCHSHLEGAVVGAEPFEIKSDSTTKFKDLPVDWVWAGHFHKPQVLSVKPIAFYPGSIQCVDFNERYDVKGVVIVDTVTRSYQPAGFMTRRLVQIDLVDRINLVDTDLREVADAIVKVTVDIDESLLLKYDESTIRSTLVTANVHNVASIILNVRREKIVRDAEIKLDTGLKQNFQRFVGGKDFVNKDSVLVEGTKVIDQCVS